MQTLDSSFRAKKGEGDFYDHFLGIIPVFEIIRKLSGSENIPYRCCLGVLNRVSYMYLLLGQHQHKLVFDEGIG